MQTGPLRRRLIPKLDEYAWIAEAAEYLDVSSDTLCNWGRTGKLPEYRHPVNNYRLFKVSDLDKLLKKTEQSVAKRIRKPR